MNTPFLNAERTASTLGKVEQNWALAHGFAAQVYIYRNGSCSVSVHAPQIWDHLMFEAKRVLPLLEEFEVELEVCIDGWNFKIKEHFLCSFINRLNEIINQRTYQL